MIPAIRITVGSKYLWVRFDEKHNWIQICERLLGFHLKNIEAVEYEYVIFTMTKQYRDYTGKV